MKILPRSLKGWLAIISWSALILALLQNVNLNIKYGHTPIGPSGEKPQTYFDFEFKSLFWNTQKQSTQGRYKYYLDNGNGKTLHYPDIEI